MITDKYQELIVDLIKLRNAVGAIQKNSKNPHFGNTFADLNSVKDAIEAHITESGFIGYTQAPITKEGKNYLQTVFYHKNGEVFSGDLELITVRTDPQMLGSSLSYARRYMLITMLDLKTEDDDGSKGSGLPDLATSTQLGKLEKLGVNWVNLCKAYKVSDKTKLTKEQADEAIKTKEGQAK